MERWKISKHWSVNKSIYMDILKQKEFIIENEFTFIIEPVERNKWIEIEWKRRLNIIGKEDL